MIAKPVAREVDADFFSVRCSDIVELCGAIKDIAIRRTIDTARTSSISRQDVAEALKKVRSSVRQADIDRIRQWEAQAE